MWVYTSVKHINIFITNENSLWLTAGVWVLVISTLFVERIIVNTVLACNAFAISTCWDALDVVFVAAASAATAIAIAVARREPKQFLRSHGFQCWNRLITIMSTYRPPIVTGIQRHALQQDPVPGLEVGTERMLCCCTFCWRQSLRVDLSGSCLSREHTISTSSQSITARCSVNVLENGDTCTDHRILSSSYVKENVHEFVNLLCTELFQ